ncbi:MAG TPA: SRPBCC family protein [Niastella sp.]
MHSNRDKLMSAATCQRLASVVGGIMLIGSALNKNSSRRFLKAATGCFLAYKGLAGRRTFGEMYHSIEKVAAGRTLNIRVSMVVNKPREEVYAMWRNLSNLPYFMKHLERVEEQDELYSNWVMEIPGKIGTLQWHAEIVKERPGEMIAWQSLPGSSIDNAGKVGFRDSLGGQGTTVDVVLTYHAPLGRAGEQIARLFTPVFKRMVEEEIRGFKDFVETHETILLPR